jgi:hypothetical protein
VKRLDAMREARIVNADHTLLPGFFAEAAIMSMRAAGTRLAVGLSRQPADGTKVAPVARATKG